MKTFRDRRDAGQRLAAALERYRKEDVLVLGLARGGLPVAQEVARALGAPLDVMVSRKIGAPINPEYGLGAIAPGGILVLDEAAAADVGATPEQLHAVVREETAEMERRLVLYRGSRDMPDVEAKTVILVDDGVATGGTARASLRALRAAGASRVVLAVPVGPPDTVASLRAEADDVVCLETPEFFSAVGRWYDRFDQTSDDEVIAILTRAGHAPAATAEPRAVRIPESRDIVLDGDLTVPADAVGLVVFAHGSGSSRKSPRNRMVARKLNESGLATLLLDLLTPEEEAEDEVTAELRFDIPFLARRTETAIRWAREEPTVRGLGVATFGSSTGGAAALIAAADLPDEVRAVVSRGGRPDLAAARLADVRAPTLLIVGGDDDVVIQLNEAAYAKLRCEKRMHIVPGATHLFVEPGTLEEVAREAASWIRAHVAAPEHAARRAR